jgi:hypothetical protein
MLFFLPGERCLWKLTVHERRKEDHRRMDHWRKVHPRRCL